ncbi:MAG: radical SAM protein [Myxococcota bacterium]
MSRRSISDAIVARRGRERLVGPEAFREGPYRVAMVYPSPYRAGMSSLGYQRIIALLRSAGLSVERVFVPDDVAVHDTARVPPLSYETLTPLDQFPLIAVSFAYETELIGLFDVLRLAGIPIRREDRRPGHPQILLGGPISMASPSFLAEFIDAAILGEGEDVAATAATTFFDASTRDEWLDGIASLPGGWVPERQGDRFPIATTASDRHLPARSLWLAPEAELSDMFLIEGERGCHRMCTFCVMRRTTHGGMRLVPPNEILSFIPEEAQKVGLVGAAISDHPQLIDLIGTLARAGKRVSLSSLRADQIARKPEIAKYLAQSGARSLTTASDGASERVRRLLKKTTTEDHLLACARQAGDVGFSHFKLYMVIGVPDENDADLEELARFTRELSAACRPARLVMGIAPFVAKRSTPLDGAPFAGIKTIDRRMRDLKKRLKGAAELRPVSARWAWIEYELAQGGAETGLAMLRGYEAGGRFADYRRALAEVDPSTKRPWTHHEAPLVDPVVRRRTDPSRPTA